MIYDDYIAYCNEYKEQYGEYTVVLMQVGDFFELYAVTTEDVSGGGIAGADIYKIADLCNLQVSKKNKSIECTRQNPLMAGFPMYILQKHVQTLVHANYTCVIIRQVTPPPNVVRKVTEIVSPSTYMSPSGFDAPFLMVMFWNSLGKTRFGDVILGVGMCWIDLTTGDCNVYEVGSHANDRLYAKDEAFRILKTVRPREIVCCFDASVEASAEAGSVLSHLQIPDNVCLHVKPSSQTNCFASPAYQNDVLEKVYGARNTTLLSITDFLGITYLSMACTALCAAIQFAFVHNEDIPKHLKPCVVHDRQDKLQLQYNSALQLNLISYNPMEKPLADILNRCATAIGKRRFLHSLLNPSCDEKWIAARYQAIQSLLEGDRYAGVAKKLSGVLDLERIVRKMALISLAPYEWNGVHSSLEASKEAFAIAAGTLAGGMGSPIASLAGIQDAYLCVLDLDEASKYNLSDITGSIFVKGVHADIDELHERIERDLRVFTELAENITSIGGDTNSTLCRFEYNDRDGHYLIMTATRWKQVAARGATDVKTASDHITLDIKDLETRTISAQSNMIRITHPHLRALSSGIFEKQRVLSHMVQTRYKEFLAHFFETHRSALESIVYEIGELDVHSTNAKNAREYCYCHPEVRRSDASDASEAGSYVEAEGLRHPIIERISNGTLYVTNDIRLGTDDLSGMLLYGVNSSGKSSLMKAIGLSIIMAQAGMYVPAARFVYKPYHQLFTRISGADNIYRGMSTFVVEMTELRNILLRCDPWSIVLGDELCAGTESLSAVSIVGAGIEYLARTRASFIFATHLHELQDVMQLPAGVRNYHMHVEFDKNKKIKYDRLLKEGIGSSYYGLEVCCGIDMPSDFLEKANIIRKSILGVGDAIIEDRMSRYNAQVRMDTCRVCGSKASEVHHIKYQHTADARGFIGHHSMNHTANLVPLCEACHQKEHSGLIQIQGYVQTNQGVELQVAKVAPAQALKCKNEEGVLAEVQDLLKYTPKGWVGRKNKRGRWREMSDEDAATYLRTTSQCDLEVLKVRLAAKR